MYSEAILTNVFSNEKPTFFTLNYLTLCTKVKMHNTNKKYNFCVKTMNRTVNIFENNFIVLNNLNVGNGGRF